MDPKITIVDVIVALTALGGAISGIVAFWTQQRERRLKVEAATAETQTKLIEAAHSGKLAEGDYITDIGATYAALSQVMETRIKTLMASVDRLQERNEALEAKYNQLLSDNADIRKRMNELEDENEYLRDKLQAREAKIAALEARIAELERGNGTKS